MSNEIIDTPSDATLIVPVAATSAAQPTVPPPPPPVPPKAKATPEEPRSGSRSGGLWLGSLALLLAVGALVGGGMMWQKIDFTQQEMARRSQEGTAQSAETRSLASQAEALTHELQARLTVAEVKLSEVSLQRSQLEELMLSVSRSRDDNLVQDIDSALRLGMQQTQLTGSAQPLLAALQAADQRISRSAQPRLNPVQRAIARDVERIQSAALTDVPSLVRKLDELSQQVDSWPVHIEWRSVAKTEVAQDLPSAIEPAPSVESPSESAAVGAAASAGWARFTLKWNHFWTLAWRDATRSGRELVRVSRIDRPEAALMAPEQVFFLRENIKLRLLNARLEILSRQMEAAQGDLQSTENALERYFDSNEVSVKSALEALAQLRAEVSASDLPRPDESLAALATAAGGR